MKNIFRQFISNTNVTISYIRYWVSVVMRIGVFILLLRPQLFFKHYLPGENNILDALLMIILSKLILLIAQKKTAIQYSRK